MPDMAPEQDNGNDVHREVDDTEADIDMKELQKDFGKQTGKTAVTARKEISALGKIIHSERVKK